MSPPQLPAPPPSPRRRELEGTFENDDLSLPSPRPRRASLPELSRDGDEVELQFADRFFWQHPHGYLGLNLWGVECRLPPRLLFSDRVDHLAWCWNHLRLPRRPFQWLLHERLDSWLFQAARLAFEHALQFGFEPPGEPNDLLNWRDFAAGIDRLDDSPLHVADNDDELHLPQFHDGSAPPPSEERECYVYERPADPRSCFCRKWGQRPCRCESSSNSDHERDLPSLSLKPRPEPQSQSRAGPRPTWYRCENCPQLHNTPGCSQVSLSGLRAHRYEVATLTTERPPIALNPLAPRPNPEDHNSNNQNSDDSDSTGVGMSEEDWDGEMVVESERGEEEEDESEADLRLLRLTRLRHVPALLPLLLAVISDPDEEDEEARLEELTVLLVDFLLSDDFETSEDENAVWVRGFLRTFEENERERRA